MFDNYSHLLNVAVAILLTISPHFLDRHGVSQAEVKKLMTEAQKHAQHIIETGDASELAGLESAMAELEQYRPQLEAMAPVIDQVADRLGVRLAMADTGQAP